MRIRVVDLTVGVLMALVMAEPAFAVSISPAPAPVAGLGIGAAALIGAGYRALRKRLDR